MREAIENLEDYKEERRRHLESIRTKIIEGQEHGPWRNDSDYPAEQNWIVSLPNLLTTRQEKEDLAVWLTLALQRAYLLAETANEITIDHDWGLYFRPCYNAEKFFSVFPGYISQCYLELLSEGDEEIATLALEITKGIVSRTEALLEKHGSVPNGLLLTGVEDYELFENTVSEQGTKFLDEYCKIFELSCFLPDSND